MALSPLLERQAKPALAFRLGPVDTGRWQSPNRPTRRLRSGAGKTIRLLAARAGPAGTLWRRGPFRDSHRPVGRAAVMSPRPGRSSPRDVRGVDDEGSRPKSPRVSGVPHGRPDGAVRGHIPSRPRPVRARPRPDPVRTGMTGSGDREPGGPDRPAAGSRPRRANQPTEWRMSEGSDSDTVEDLPALLCATGCPAPGWSSTWPGGRTRATSDRPTKTTSTSSSSAGTCGRWRRACRPGSPPEDPAEPATPSLWPTALAATGGEVASRLAISC